MKTPITLPQTKTLLPKKGAMVSPAMISTHIKEPPAINMITAKVLSWRYLFWRVRLISREGCMGESDNAEIFFEPEALRLVEAKLSACFL
jgi:hypothetical protein